MNVAEFDLGYVVRRVVDEAREIGAERGIELTCEVGDAEIVLSGDETQLGVAVGAVIKNAIEAVGANGHVEAVLRRSTVGDESWAEVIVSDDGPGISAEVRRHLFDPFFSGREAGRGLGFGLSKCWRIVTLHGGSVVVNSVGGAGAEFTISLPLNSAPCGPTS